MYIVLKHIFFPPIDLHLIQKVTCAMKLTTKFLQSEQKGWNDAAHGLNSLRII